MTEAIALDTGHPHVRFKYLRDYPINKHFSHFNINFPEYIIPEIDHPMNNKQKLNVNEMKQIIHFWELPDSIRIKLKNSYSNYLFIKLFKRNDLNELCNKIKLSKSQIYHLKNNRYSMKISTLLIISVLIKESLYEIEKNIDYINSTRGGKAYIKFPIKSNENIASLIGHCYGDGSIFTKKSQFKFCNFNERSLEEVKDLINNEFKTNTINKSKTTITYSSIIGTILNKFGAHRGDKLKLTEDVPNWIKEGNKKIKSRFIRAIFDDDGSVSLSGNNKNINFHQIVLREYNLYSMKFLKSIVDILKEFKIFAHGPFTSRKYSIEGKERFVNYLIITDWESIKNYSKTINFYHSSKKEKLSIVLKRKKAESKYEMELYYKSIIGVFKKYKEPISTKLIAEKINKPTRFTYKRLSRLRKNNIINNVGRISNRSYLWKLNGGGKKSQNVKI